MVLVVGITLVVVVVVVTDFLSTVVSTTVGSVGVSDNFSLFRLNFVEISELIVVGSNFDSPSISEDFLSRRLAVVFKNIFSGFRVVSSDVVVVVVLVVDAGAGVSVLIT